MTNRSRDGRDGGIAPRLLDTWARAAAELGGEATIETLSGRVADWVRPHVEFETIRLLRWNAVAGGFEATPRDAGGGVPGPWGAAADDCARLRRPVRAPSDAGPGNGRAALAVPLLSRERLLGVLDMGRSGGGPFTDRDEALVGAVACHVAAALEIARLREVVARQARSLERERAMAGEIQQCLLRASLGRIPSVDVGTAYLPASALGGDFYDFLPLGNERLLVAAGDVAGKGTPAALHAALAMGMLRGQIIEKQGGPAETLRRLNGSLALPGIDNRFVTLLFAMIDAPSRTVHVANAGFPEPILLRRGHLQRIRVRGVPLGLLPDIVYDEIAVALEPGDVMALVSDGLQEAIDGQEQQFGDRFLVDVMCALSTQRAEWIAQGLIRASTAYAGENEEHPDDRSVVVLKVGTF